MRIITTRWIVVVLRRAVGSEYSDCLYAINDYLNDRCSAFGIADWSTAVSGPVPGCASVGRAGLAFDELIVTLLNYKEALM